MAYTYWPDGTIHEESYYSFDSSGVSSLRRKMTYAADAHRRQTYQKAGASTAGTRGFDGNDNLVATGLPFNSPPAFCKDGIGNHDPRCSKQVYDRANRLLETQEFPTTGSTPIKTCFGYDAVGNITTVVHGCSTSVSCEGTDGRLNPAALPAQCQSGVSTYQYDDFGRLAVAIPSLPT